MDEPPYYYLLTTYISYLFQTTHIEVVEIAVESTIAIARLEMAVVFLAESLADTPVDTLAVSSPSR
jgi:isopropylmalate/homocitrate/citramalate synthase